jgi:arylsulfatase A-like enzyme
MRINLIILFSIILFIGSCRHQGPQKAGSGSPNIILIVADDLGYGDLSCYGQDVLNTPNINRMASEGITFTNHYT